MLPSPLLRCLARLAFFLPCAALAQGVVTLQLTDYAALPQSGSLASSPDNAVYVARVNFLREEPGSSLNRFFVCDLNGKLYLVDKTTKQFTTYLDFQRNTAEIPAATGIFPAFTRNAGYANGLVTFQFDPEYRTAGSPNFGKFYTVHIEIDTNDGDPRRLPNASAHPGFSNAASYAPTAVNEAPGTDGANTRHAVLIEWQDTNPTNNTFEGTARELLRIEFNGRIHPLGDLLFNPLATSAAHADWRKLYLAVGDGGAGEQNNATLHSTPQRLDVLQGKILRISPDDPDGSGPRTYGIPADNPFLDSIPSASIRGEIYAYGFRNPHRLSWDAASNQLIACDIGFHSWEEVNLVRRGGNYGWGEREGNMALDVATGTAVLPLPANEATNNFLYPVIQYAHSSALGFGDAIAGGFVYRGTSIPELRGKFVFGDITTGQLFYADLLSMTLADDGNPTTLAGFNRIELLWDNPRDAAPAQRYDRLYEIVESEYHARGGTDANLPGSATVSDLTGGGRADIRLAMDNAGELYVLSKSDGMIRTLGAAPAPASAPTITRQPEAQTIAVGGTVVFSVEAGNAAAYQWKRNNGLLPGATGPTLTLAGTTADRAGTYSVDVINAAGITTSSAVALAVESTSDAGRITNLSIRSTAGTGAQTLTVGFVLDGAAGANFDRELLLRAIGPGLSTFGLTGVLPDPKITLFNTAGRLQEADNWWEPIPEARDGFSGRFGTWTLPIGSRDAVLIPRGLPRGAYSVQVTSAVADQTGVALAEIYDSPGAPANTRELVNVSARTLVTAGEGTLIAGFVIGGSTARTVLIRAAGPVLATFGLAGTLPDPRLTLFRGNTRIAENDNWQTSTEMVGTFSATGAFPFVARSRDAVLCLTLAPGVYSAQVNGIGTANGIALVEVYVLP